MQIYQPHKGYCFNSDTLFLYDFIRSFPIRGTLLEVGSGSGILGLLIARELPVSLTQVEKQELFYRFSLKNAEVNGIRSEVVHSDFLHYSATDAFDTIISNPPFYHGGVMQSEDSVRHTARYNEHLPIDEFIAKASKMLSPRGRFIFCYDPQQLQKLLVSLHNAKLTAEDIRFVYPKAGKMATLVMIHARKGSKSLCRTHPPLVAFEGEQFSEEAALIYASAGTHSIKCEI